MKIATLMLRKDFKFLLGILSIYILIKIVAVGFEFGKWLYIALH